MSKIAELLLKEAQALSLDEGTKAAVGHLKQAGISESDALAMIAKERMTEEAVGQLVAQGIEKAAAEAAVATELNDVKIVNIGGNSRIVDVLEKAASYISDLEQQVSELHIKIEKKAEEKQEQEVPESLNKLAGLGFSREELDALHEVPEQVLNKIANATEQPWGLGEAAGIPRAKTDPLLEFILGDAQDRF